MEYLHHNLGSRQQGEIVEVTLTNGANVRLMNNLNFLNYKSGRRCSFLGGLAKESPVRLEIPNFGHWHVVIDMESLRGSTRAEVMVLPNS